MGNAHHGRGQRPKWYKIVTERLKEEIALVRLQKTYVTYDNMDG